MHISRIWKIFVMCPSARFASNNTRPRKEGKFLVRRALLTLDESSFFDLAQTLFFGRFRFSVEGSYGWLSLELKFLSP
uniref:Uncharacterized protein n=1 Tax=Steinernema glaseri TaxID=37863 RepID=A0A1I7YIC3_9BILA